MNLKCIATNVSEIVEAGVKKPVYTAVLEPVGGGATVRITGGAGSVATTMTYGQTYSINAA